jgi:hypothetical protein
MNKKTILKTLVIGLMSILVLSSITPSASSQINQTNSKQTLLMEDWCDNFDSYTNDQFLDGGPEDGGWKGWFNDPNAGAYVVDDQALSAPHSVEIIGATDLVHEYAGYTSGKWNYTAMQYIPTDFSGDSYFILLSGYDDAGATNVWAVQLSFNSATGLVESQFNAETLDYNLGVWTEIRCEIDLTGDWLEIYYGDQLLASHAWSDTVQSSGGGPLAIAAVDLYANGASAVYYDDICLEAWGGGQPTEPDLDCEGSLTWVDIQAGAAVSGDFIVKNIGSAGSELNWEIASYPTDWGTEWTFTPSSGTITGVDQVTVEVTLNAPLKKKQTFTGIVKIVNSDNSSDFCEIDVSLTTPRARMSNFIQTLLQRFPNAFPVLRYILNL